MASAESTPLERRLQRAADATVTAREKREVDAAAEQFARFTANDGRLAPERVQRATISLVAALNDSVTVDDPPAGATPDADAQLRRLVAMRLAAGDARQFAAIRQRQVALMELALRVTRMGDEEFGAIDVAAHLSMIDALVRYTSAWARVYALVQRRVATEGDVDLIEATLNDVLAVGRIGYGFCGASGGGKVGGGGSGGGATVVHVRIARGHPSETMHSDAIQDLHGLRRRVADESSGSGGGGDVNILLPLSRYGRQFVKEIGVIFEWFMAVALSDRYLMLWVGIDALDVHLPALAPTSLLVSGGGVLAEWLDTSAALSPLAPAVRAATTTGGVSATMRLVITPYTLTKELIKTTLAKATRYVFSSPLARAGTLDRFSDDHLIFALPLWSWLVLLRLFAVVAKRAQSAFERQRARSNQSEGARTYLERQKEIREGRQFAVDRQQLDAPTEPNQTAAVRDADFGSASDGDDYHQ